MSSYIFDVETNGIEDFVTLSDLHEIHCIVLKDIETGEVFRCNHMKPATGLPIEAGLKALMHADLLVGQNIIGFDIPAIKKLYPWFVPLGEVRDTKVAASLIWPLDILKPKDFILSSKGKLPARLIGHHSLEAWGHRIGEYKSAKVSFDNWSQELEDYCVQDVEVTAKLWQMICSKNYSPMAMWLEHAVAWIIHEQEVFGAPFDEKAAASLYADLVQARLDRERECQKLFGPWLAFNGVTTPKRDNKKKGIFAGCAYTKLKEVEFNPGSRQHIGNRLMKVRGWKPTEFTSEGDPEINEIILSKLPYPEAKILTRYLLVQKRIGQLAEGKKALLKFVKNGRIHGRVITNGTVTGRAAHADPNLGQVPKVKLGKDKKPLTGEAGGWEFRSLFRAPQPWVMVGADASGLELRMLAHYMFRWDVGAYAKEVVEGDVHSLTMAALGITSRDIAKTWMYAWLYGAGDAKLGKILGKGKAAGAASRKAVMNKIPALGRLVEAVKKKHREIGHLLGLDKRVVYTRSEHAALNTLLQCAGALVCKLWLVLLHAKLRRAGYKPGIDYQQVLWVHDETQILARSEVADAIGKIAKEAVKEAGEFFGLKVPLDGEYKVGDSWSQTH